MESVLNWSVIISIIGVLVVLTNIVVQVLKKVTWDKLPTNALAMIVSLVLTLGAFFAYCSIKEIAVVWYGDFEWFVSEDPYVSDTPPWFGPGEPHKEDNTPFDVR